MIISVLLAEDHSVVREGLRHLLEAQDNMRVVGEAANGREAVRFTERLNPNVVVMDISMPELNGIDAAAQIVEQFPNTKVVMLSVYSSIEYISRALVAGAMGYVLKESAGQELVAAVRSANCSRRYLSEKIDGREIKQFIKKRQEPAAIDQLSLREREILQLVVEGKSSAAIARSLFLSPKTVETYRCRLMNKLDIKGIPSLVKFAIRHGMTSLDD